MTINQKLVAKLETTVTTKPNSNVGRITFRRPVVSAKNPQRCELLIIPAKPIALNMPRSCMVKLRSHCETGKTKLMPKVSSKTLANIKPDTNMSM